MDYSKIVTVELINFMVYEHAKASFDESGIMTIYGYNSSGKSVFLLAIAVAMMNMYPSKQTKYIRHDTEYFRIVITFDDGVVLVRDKYYNGQSLYELYKGTKKVYSSKIGSKLTKIDAVPEIIEKYLGLVKTDLGYLNYQARRDPMWLIDTKGSENYYSVNEVLRTVEIARANAMLNSDINQLNSEITVIENDIANSRSILESMTDVKEDLLVALSEREVRAQGIIRKYDAIYDICALIEDLSSTQNIPEISLIKVNRLNKISSVLTASREIESMKLSPDMERVDISKLGKLSNINTLLTNIGKISGDSFDVELEPVQYSKLEKVSSLRNVWYEFEKHVAELQSINKQGASLVEERDSIISEAEKEGIEFVVCNNCGTLLEVDTGRVAEVGGGGN